jgi:hypothetical protein
MSQSCFQYVDYSDKGMRGMLFFFVTGFGANRIFVICVLGLICKIWASNFFRCHFVAQNHVE